MNTETKPANLPETLVWYYIIGAYIFYLLGGQYIFAPLLATVLVFLVCQKWWGQTPRTPFSERIDFCPLTWIWIVAMLMMEVALIVGHINFDLSITQIVKSSLYWYKHWALFALFPVAAYLKIRPQIIYRASCIFCTLCLVLVLLSSSAYLIHLPIFSYVSPFQALGGDEMYYTVNLLFQEPTYNEGFRLQLFAPWPPALGLMGNIYFFLTYQETDSKWRWLGMLGAIAMIVMSVSRLAIICILFVGQNEFKPLVERSASLGTRNQYLKRSCCFGIYADWYSSYLVWRSISSWIDWFFLFFNTFYLDYGKFNQSSSKFSNCKSWFLLNFGVVIIFFWRKFRKFSLFVLARSINYWHCH